MKERESAMRAVKLERFVKRVKFGEKENWNKEKRMASRESEGIIENNDDDGGGVLRWVLDSQSLQFLIFNMIQNW